MNNSAQRTDSVDMFSSSLLDPFKASTQPTTNQSFDVQCHFDAGSTASFSPPTPTAHATKPVVGSIRVIRNRLISEGYQVSEYMLRQMVKQSIIPAVYSGSKALISYASVIDVLTRATG